MSKVISIVSVSGGGKTTIINELSKQLDNSAALYFDDYSFDEYIEYGSWLKNGANYDEWDLMRLKNDIDKPLDAAMARRIFRDMFDASGGQIRKYIENYIKYERPLYQYMIDNIMPDSDIVVDGLLPVCDIVDKIRQACGQCAEISG